MKTEMIAKLPLGEINNVLMPLGRCIVKYQDGYVLLDIGGRGFGTVYSSSVLREVKTFSIKELEANEDKTNS